MEHEIKTEELVVGKDYWLDSCKDVSGIFIKIENNKPYFKRTSGTDYIESKSGLIGFFGRIGGFYERD